MLARAGPSSKTTASSVTQGSAPHGAIGGDVAVGGRFRLMGYRLNDEVEREFKERRRKGKRERERKREKERGGGAAEYHAVAVPAAAATPPPNDACCRDAAKKFHNLPESTKDGWSES